ncbi:OSBPL9 isoform 9 [Pongo abelii]|uniref:OSBPL9 isoform 9 n=1 Tax=Pongo abelii TaxID=9601 RepID=A0A2J8V8K8_PONAB|nr:OSBPL9 isoform 9 [Pongo abelii]
MVESIKHCIVLLQIAKSTILVRTLLILLLVLVCMGCHNKIP